MLCEIGQGDVNMEMEFESQSEGYGVSGSVSVGGSGSASGSGSVPHSNAPPLGREDHLIDHPGLLLVTKLLNGDNYPTWKRSMIIALTAKNKIGFVNGSIKAPSQAKKPADFTFWKRTVLEAHQPPANPHYIVPIAIRIITQSIIVTSFMAILLDINFIVVVPTHLCMLTQGVHRTMEATTSGALYLHMPIKSKRAHQQLRPKL
ncbi:unnamed protein product, partial [Prunus brigantina]